MFVGMLILLVCAYYAVGGVIAGPPGPDGHEGPGRRRLQGDRPPGLDGHAAVRLGQATGRRYNLWWIVVTTIVLGVGIGVLAQPQLVVRFMTVKSKRELNRALAIGGIVHPADDRRGLHRRRLSNVYFSKHEVVRGKLVGPPETGERGHEEGARAGRPTAMPVHAAAPGHARRRRRRHAHRRRRAWARRVGKRAHGRRSRTWATGRSRSSRNATALHAGRASGTPRSTSGCSTPTASSRPSSPAPCRAGSRWSSC